MIANPQKKIQELDERVRQLETRVAKLEGKPDTWRLIGTTGHGVEPGMPQHPMEKMKAQVEEGRKLVKHDSRKTGNTVPDEGSGEF